MATVAAATREHDLMLSKERTERLAKVSMQLAIHLAKLYTAQLVSAHILRRKLHD